MQLTKKIQNRIKELPEVYQIEVLDFVEYLLSKSQQDVSRQEDIDWSAFSLDSAMRGMEDENVPLYSEEDIKVVFS